MHRLILISIDLLFVASATVIAVMLRGNFDTVSDSLLTLMPYTFISISCASVVFFSSGLDRTPWRYSTVSDHLQIIILSVLVILLALVVTFALNRLEPVARSLPVLQGALIVIVLVSSRSVARIWYARQIRINGDSLNRNGYANTQSYETVLIVGVNTLTELFLLSVKELASKRVQVAGVLAEEPKMLGRVIQQKPILGTVEELQNVLQSLEVHGVSVNRIVVAIAANQLRRSSLESLFEVEKSSDIIVQFLSEQLGLEPSVLSDQERDSVPKHRAVSGSLINIDHSKSMLGSFWLGKRIVDVVGSALLIFALSPVAALIVSIVALDVGFPVIFWQQRPGLNGRPFKLYKFRTMRSPHDEHKRRIPDDQRSSSVGQILRRTRLDELPQLYNVLIGNMSLIGPRPLLPRDQSPDYAARLSVRPGITGWAQVNGGRIIAPSEKLMLDIWYVNHASFSLDFKIILRTVSMVLFGDRINVEAVKQARSDLSVIVPAE